MTNSKIQVSSAELVWGAANIAKVIGRTERATFHLLEKGSIPGAKRIGGRWCLAPAVFFATFADGDVS